MVNIGTSPWGPEVKPQCDIKRTFGSITTMELTEVNCRNEIKRILNIDESYFTLKPIDIDIWYTYKISIGNNGVRWLCVQTWDGAYVFSAGIDSKGKLFRCKPKWCNPREYIASGIPESVSSDITFLNKHWGNLNEGVVPTNIKFYHVINDTSIIRTRKKTWEV